MRSLTGAVSGPARTRLLVIGCVLSLSALLGFRADLKALALILALGIGIALLSRPMLGLELLIVAALLAPIEVGTGTMVVLNAATLLVPVLAALWLFDRLRHRDLGLVASPVNQPLALFLVSGLLSLAVGIVLWDPAVPRPRGFLLVQLAQWAIFALSAIAFWLTANLVKTEQQLQRLTWTFLIIGGGLAILKTAPGVRGLVGSLGTVAFIRAPFWVLLAGLAGGQLLFNPALGRGMRTFLVLVSVTILYYAFIWQRESVSNWTGIGAVLVMLLWLRFRRLRWPAIAILVSLSLVGLLFPTLYEFGGGEDEWVTSGGSRIALITRVLQVTARNPITGLGPAAYRLYAAMEPLGYGQALWLHPSVSSHNNYVDILSHCGVVGLGFFAWALLELLRAGFSMEHRSLSGFMQGLAKGLISALVGAIVVMALADWFLPFVYNIGFGGLQASILMWLFLGGLVASGNVVPSL